MSRIGKMPITIPAGVDVTIGANNEITVKGAKGTLTETMSPTPFKVIPMTSKPQPILATVPGANTLTFFFMTYVIFVFMQMAHKR